MKFTALNAALLFVACVHVAPVSQPPTLVTELARAEAADAGVSAQAAAGWDTLDAGDAPRIAQASHGEALLPDAGWATFGPSCIVAAGRCEAGGQKLAGADATVAELERVPPGVVPQIISAAIGFALGCVAAFVGVCEIETGSPVCLRH